MPEEIIIKLIVELMFYALVGLSETQKTLYFSVHGIVYDEKPIKIDSQPALFLSGILKGVSIQKPTTASWGLHIFFTAGLFLD